MAKKDRPQTELARQIIVRRNAEGYTQEGLAALLGCSKETVSRWEAGTRVPRSHNAKALVRVLGFTHDELRQYSLNALMPHYIWRDFGQARAVLGEWDALSKQIDAVMDEIPIPDGEGNFMGDPEKWMRIYEKSPDTGITVFKGDALAAFWYCIAVRPSVYEEILCGENVNASISDDNVCSLVLPETYDLYFVDLFIQRDHFNLAVHRILLTTFFDFLRTNAQEGIFFRRISAHISTSRAKGLCEDFGFRYVRDHKTHTWAPGVPSWIYELNLDPHGEAYCFTHDPELRRLYSGLREVF